MIRRDVVLARDEHRERDVGERRQQLLDSRAHGRAPRLALRLVAARSEVAREHPPVAELLRGEAPLGRDDERLEQPLADRLAQEEEAVLSLDRELDSERPQEVGRVGARRDDDGVCEPRLERVDRPDADVEPAAERLDNALRPVEVAVLRAPGAADDRVGAEAGDELGRLVGRDEARRARLRRSGPRRSRRGAREWPPCARRTGSRTRGSRAAPANRAARPPRRRTPPTRAPAGRRPACPTAGGRRPAGRRRRLRRSRCARRPRRAAPRPGSSRAIASPTTPAPTTATSRLSGSHVRNSDRNTDRHTRRTRVRGSGRCSRRPAEARANHAVPSLTQLPRVQTRLRLGSGWATAARINGASSARNARSLGSAPT